MAHKILLFLGAGANVGTAAVKKFHNERYKVVSVARTIRPEVKAHSDLVLTTDFSDPSSIQGIFDRTEKEIGVPNVVIYNPFSWSHGPDPTNPLSPSIDSFLYDFNINTASPYAAAQATVKGFAKLPDNVKKTFIYTGNNGNTFIMPSFHELGIGKAAFWYTIQTLVATPQFSKAGYRFYYVDERTPEGRAMHAISGPGHSEIFLDLAESDSQKAPLHTFVRGKGHVKFEWSDGAHLPVVGSVWGVLDPGYGMPGTFEGSLMGMFVLMGLLIITMAAFWRRVW